MLGAVAAAVRLGAPEAKSVELAWWPRGID